MWFGQVCGCRVIGCVNLLGNEGFCPVVRKTEVLKHCLWENLRDHAAGIVHPHDAETLTREVSYLYSKEIRSSFAIEHEDPSKTKMERFGEALRSIRKFPHLDNKQVLIDLQSIMLDERVAAPEYQDDQNYVGETFDRREIFYLTKLEEVIFPV